MYRCWLYEDGREREDEEGNVTKRGFAAEIADAVQAAGRSVGAEGFGEGRGCVTSAMVWRWEPRRSLRS